MKTTTQTTGNIETTLATLQAALDAKREEYRALDARAPHAPIAREIARLSREIESVRMALARAKANGTKWIKVSIEIEPGLIEHAIVDANGNKATHYALAAEEMMLDGLLPASAIPWSADSIPDSRFPPCCAAHGRQSNATFPGAPAVCGRCNGTGRMP